MIPLSTTIWLENPKHTVEGQALPPVLARFSLSELCQAAQIACRMSGGMQDEKRVLICSGGHHFRVAALPIQLAYVGVKDNWKLDRVRALRVLEVLAYAFHDYETRECVSFQGLFVSRRPRGRPPTLWRARTAAERMRDMRARKARKVLTT